MACCSAAVRHKTASRIRLLIGSLARLIYLVIGVATGLFAHNSTAQHSLLYTRNTACYAYTGTSHLV